MTAKRPARIGKRLRLCINLTGLGIWASGAVWLVLHDLMVRPGAFGPEYSPLEPWGLRIHGAFAFLALWLGGLLWGLHIVNGWGQNRRRWSGGALLGAVLTLILSGYLLYYVGEDQPRAVISLIHWIIGLGAPIAYGAHRWLEPRLARRPARP